MNRKKMSYVEQSHPSTLQRVTYEPLEDADLDFVQKDCWPTCVHRWQQNRGQSPSCTVFRSELYALHKPMLLIKSRTEPKVLSDSQPYLDLLMDSKAEHALAKSIRENIWEIRAEDREIQLFWLKAHIADYDKVPLSYVKKRIRYKSVLKWQDRHQSSSTGEVTRRFLPSVEETSCAVKISRLTPHTDARFRTFLARHNQRQENGAGGQQAESSQRKL
ncbi:hypothetical protein EVAR_75566_1 [Eumeta japonica]|uniref:Uncharacterized protein n=1 Tax=Eumeta variegata TaxID=151549 RepID=A0A4C1UKL7_EUMVA|nr:hypothetical protein EVAR_75566_1 [Eumeta japonica]